MIRFLSFALLFTTCLLPYPAGAAEVVDTPFDLQGFIQGELAKGHKEVTVPPGRYRVTPQHARHLSFEGLEDVTVNAAGVEMICTETTLAVRIAHCRNLTIRGLAIDYDPLPFTQGRITALSPDKSVHEIELFDGYPDTSGASDFKYEIFRMDTRTLRTHDYSIKTFEKLDATHLRITRASASANDPEQIGDLVVMGNVHAPGGNAAHGVQLDASSGVRLEDIDLFASNCFGFFETGCTGTTYLRCHIERCPPERDCRARASARIRSLNADAYHSKYAPKGPSLIGCSAHFMGDDAVNICGSYHLVTSGAGDTWRVLANAALFKEGDLLELFTYEGVRLPDTRVVKIVPDPQEITDEERRFLAVQRMAEGFRTNWKPKTYRVTFEHPVALTWFSVVASENAVGNGFAVKGCHFGENRSRGILIKASDGEISGNTIEGSWMSAVSIAPEDWWLEAGSASRLVIRDNTIRRVRGTPIGVEAEAGNGKVAVSGVHHDILISGNTISDSPLPQIRVYSTAGLRVEDNHLLPDVPAATGGEKASVVTKNCVDPVIR